jgi:hypothetical protein
MFRKYQTKNSSKSVLDVHKLHPLVIDLNEESQNRYRVGDYSVSKRSSRLS